MKAKFSITEKVLLVFEKQVSIKHFLSILAENSDSTNHVLTSLYYFLRGKKKKKAGFGLLSEGTKEDSAENGGKLPRIRSMGFVAKCSCTPNPSQKGPEECPY